MRRSAATASNLVVSRLGLAFLAAIGLSAFGAIGCATYSSDLERAQHHYDANQFEPALALFRVLEDDMDSLSTAEKAKYGYYRGMTAFRLSGIAAQGSGVNDPRKSFRDNARHWLAIAAAIEKETPGGLSDDMKQRMNETLTELNYDVFGGAPVPAPTDAVPGAPAPGAAPGAAPTSATPPGATPVAK
jgi:hypothetical protein